MRLAIPKELATERLILRQPLPEDLSAYAAYCASERTKLGGGPFTLDEARGFLEAMIAGWETHGSGRFIITKSGQPIGHAGILHNAEPELGWFLWEASSEGHGYASEATRAVLGFAFGALGLASIPAFIAPDNAPSIALAKRLGATPDGTHITPEGELSQVWRFTEAPCS